MVSMPNLRHLTGALPHWYPILEYIFFSVTFSWKAHACYDKAQLLIVTPSSPGRSPDFLKGPWNKPNWDLWLQCRKEFCCDKVHRGLGGVGQGALVGEGDVPCRCGAVVWSGGKLLTPCRQSIHVESLLKRACVGRGRGARRRRKIRGGGSYRGLLHKMTKWHQDPRRPQGVVQNANNSHTWIYLSFWEFLSLF